LEKLVSPCQVGPTSFYVGDGFVIEKTPVCNLLRKQGERASRSPAPFWVLVERLHDPVKIASKTFPCSRPSKLRGSHPTRVTVGSRSLTPTPFVPGPARDGHIAKANGSLVLIPPPGSSIAAQAARVLAVGLHVTILKSQHEPPPAFAPGKLGR
jgi:hypothetical protein